MRFDESSRKEIAIHHRLLCLTVCAGLGSAVGCREAASDERAPAAEPGKPSEVEGGDAPEAAPDPEAVARRVLEAARAKDIEVLVDLTAEKKRAQIEKLPVEEVQSKWKIFHEWRWAAVTNWDGKFHGVRYRHYVGTHANNYEAHVRFHEMSADEIAVVSLRWEGGSWQFDDIKSPSLTNWQEGREKFAEIPEPY